MKIAAGARAVEQTHVYDAMRLGVQVSAPAGYERAVQELADQIKASASLQLASNEADADMRAYVIAPRQAASVSDPAPQLGAVREATWAVVGRDGRVAMPLHAVSEPDVAPVLVENLEKISRYRAALALRNPNLNSGLKGKIAFTLLRQGLDGSWEEAQAAEVGGSVTFQQGQSAAFRITSRHNAPVYFSVLDFGLSGAISLLHPYNAPSAELAPGQTIEIGTRPGEQIELYMPDNFPFIPDPVLGTVTSGAETFKLFVTSQRSSFQSLIQGGTREARDLNPLESLLGMALTGQGTRDARPLSMGPGDDWTTAECSFVLTC